MWVIFRIKNNTNKSYIYAVVREAKTTCGESESATVTTTSITETSAAAVMIAAG